MPVNSAQIAYGRLGFKQQNMGGGCTALARYNDADGTHILITINESDVEAPTEATQPVCVALYAGDETAEPLYLAYFYAPDSDAVAFNLAHGRWIKGD
jgi:hypothetical protein